jgi:hypothetical protein
MRIFGIILFFLLLGACAFGYWKYCFVYSDGNREGLLNKFSTKGTIFKTNEGELLLPGVVPGMNQLSNNYFYFSTTDPKVTAILKDAAGQKVKVHYMQYNTALPWRGDNYDGKNKENGQYIVDQAEVILK